MIRRISHANIFLILLLIYFCGGTSNALSESESESESDRSVQDLWRTAQRVSLAEVLEDPEQFSGKPFIFYGSIDDAQFKEEDGKKFAFHEKMIPKGDSRKFQGWDEWNRQMVQQGSTGASAWVYFGEWYKQRVGTSEGKKEIRDLARLNDRSYGGMRWFVLATVKEFTDTFEAYLSLIDYRDASNATMGNLQARAQPRERVSGQSSTPQSHASKAGLAMRGPATNVVLATIEKNYEHAEKFQEHSMLIDGNFDTSWEMLVRTLEQQKETIFSQDKTTGTIITNIIKHGSLLPEYRQIIAVLEPESEGRVRLTFKALRYNSSDRQRWGEGLWVQKEDEKLIEQFRKAYSSE